MKKNTVLALVVLLFAFQNLKAQKMVERWAMFEYSLNGPIEGNPYKDVSIHATFTKIDKTKKVTGFYAGDGVYKVRFMPDETGVWEFEISSNVKKLSGIKGRFECIKAKGDNHGVVRVNGLHFKYDDGTSYYPFGTTSYAWTHQGDSLEEETVKALSSSPFNKIRMGLFPKRYRFNFNEPEYFAFEGSKDGFDFTSFNAQYWDNLEKRIEQLLEMGIEADLILFHPYDTWGLSKMDREGDDFYLKYAIARLSAYRNVWWSLANEFSLLKTKTMEDWEHIGSLIKENDPCGHLISVHNHPEKEFDWSKEWISHISIQTYDMIHVNELKENLQKPAINDECGYEGDLQFEWGNLSAEEIVHRYWTASIHGVYVTHGETFANQNDVLWWSKGGKLQGLSIARIEFLRNIIEKMDSPLNFIKTKHWGNHITGSSTDSDMLLYFGNHQPSNWEFEFPEGSYSIELIDPWNMKIKTLKQACSGKQTIQLPVKPRLALRLIKLD